MNKIFSKAVKSRKGNIGFMLLKYTFSEIFVSATAKAVYTNPIPRQIIESP